MSTQQYKRLLGTAPAPLLGYGLVHVATLYSTQVSFIALWPVTMNLLQNSKIKVIFIIQCHCLLVPHHYFLLESVKLLYGPMVCVLDSETLVCSRIYIQTFFFMLSELVEGPLYQLWCYVLGSGSSVYSHIASFNQISAMETKLKIYYPGLVAMDTILSPSSTLSQTFMQLS